jgi:hypothetical protein
MLRSLVFAALPLFSLSMVSACASSDVDDELAGESAADDAIDGKADSAADGVYTYFEVTADLRRCASPVCGGFYMKRLNRTTTVCHNGSTRADCYTPVLDWSESNLDAGQQQKLVDMSNKDATSAGVYAIVRGRFASKNTTTPRPDLGRFIVTEAWVGEGEGVSDGVFAKVKDNGVRCISAPCPSLTEKALNTSRAANIAVLDFSMSGLSDHLVEGFVANYTSDSGILIAGDRYSTYIHGRPAKGRTVTNAYHRLANAPGACFIGGCSSEICSDQEGASSTCELRPEYACYQTATCERQAGGACGWTQTAELDSCLGN